MISKKKKKIVQTSLSFGVNSFYSERPMIQDKSRHWPTLKLCSPTGVVLTSEWHLKAINKHDVIIINEQKVQHEEEDQMKLCENMWV